MTEQCWTWCSPGAGPTGRTAPAAEGGGGSRGDRATGWLGGTPPHERNAPAAGANAATPGDCCAPFSSLAPHARIQQQLTTEVSVPDPDASASATRWPRHSMLAVTGSCVALTTQTGTLSDSVSMRPAARAAPMLSCTLRSSAAAAAVSVAPVFCCGGGLNASACQGDCLEQARSGRAGLPGTGLPKHTCPMLRPPQHDPPPREAVSTGAPLHTPPFPRLCNPPPPHLARHDQALPLGVEQLRVQVAVHADAQGLAGGRVEVRHLPGGPAGRGGAGGGAPFALRWPRGGGLRMACTGGTAD